jgi:negative regulator of sigma E activity
MTSARDAELSALLDGALSAPEAAALRAQIEADPALAARFAELAQVDAALRALPARPAPADLRARLQAKLDAESAPRTGLGVIRGGAPRRRRAWIAGISAAVAATAAALMVLLHAPGELQRGAPRDEGGLAAMRPSDTAASPDEVALVVAPSAVPSEQATPSPAPLAPPAELGSPDASRVARVEGAALQAPSPSAGDGAAHPDGGLLDTTPDSSAVASTPSPQEPLELAAANSADAAATQRASEATPALWVETTDEEAEALGELAPDDASVVAVLDFLDELDVLEAEAS